MQVPRSNLWTADEARSDAATEFNVVAHKIAIMNNFMGSPFLARGCGNDHTFPGGRACRRAFERTPIEVTMM
jgi:hypothetical protein